MLYHQAVRSATPRRGTVIVFFAVSLVALLGFVAIVVDGGILLDQRRNAYATADAAAMAAACELYQGYPNYVKGQSLPTSIATTAALDVASANGFNNDTTNNEVTVHIPPTTGIYKNKDGYAEVLITLHQKRFFSAIWGSDTIAVNARAVARGAWIPYKAGVLVLDYDDKASLSVKGNGSFTETGGPVIVNSNNAAAVVDTGNGAMIAESLYVTGGVSLGAHAGLTTTPVANQVFDGVHPTPDPLAYLPVPPVSSNGTMSTVSLGKGNKQYTLTPGRYTNLPQFNSGDVVIFKQASYNMSNPMTAGVYYIDGGGFKSTGASIMMDSSTTGGMMLYNNPSSTALSEKIQITGNASGTTTMSPLTDGPYSGMMLWQNRNSPVDILVEGNGNFNVGGTFYAAGAKLNINGNGGTTTGSDGVAIAGSVIGSQYISNNLSLGGNGNIVINYTGGKKQPTRILCLVE